jgi:hypothetical protein
MVDAQMSDEKQSNTNHKILQANIDRGSWLQLLSLCEQIVETLGLVGPIIALAKDKSEREQVRCLKAIKEISVDGHLALKKFAEIWTSVNEQIMKDAGQYSSENFDDILHEARDLQLSGVWGNAFSVRSKGNDHDSHDSLPGCKTDTREGKSTRLPHTTLWQPRPAGPI